MFKFNVETVNEVGLPDNTIVSIYNPCKSQLYDKIYNTGDPLAHFIECFGATQRVSAFIIEDSSSSGEKSLSEAVIKSGRNECTRVVCNTAVYNGSNSIDIDPYSPANMRCWANTIKISLSKASVIFNTHQDRSAEIIVWALEHVAKGGSIISILPLEITQYHIGILCAFSKCMNSTALVVTKDALYVSGCGFRGCIFALSRQLSDDGTTQNTIAEAINEQDNRILRCEEIRTATHNYRGNRKVYLESLISAAKGV